MIITFLLKHDNLSLSCPLIMKYDLELDYSITNMNIDFGVLFTMKWYQNIVMFTWILMYTNPSMRLSTRQLPIHYHLHFVNFIILSFHLLKNRS